MHLLHSVSPLTLKMDHIEEEEFQPFLMKYNKEYSSEDFESRFKVHRDNTAYAGNNAKGENWSLEVTNSLT